MKLWLAILCMTAILCVASQSDARRTETADASAIACRVMEAHTSANPAATVVIFHQQHKEDQEHLGSLLRSHSGESVEIRAGSAAWTSVTIFRLKSCFGRGLMVLAPGAPVMKEGSMFLLRLPAGDLKN